MAVTVTVTVTVRMAAGSEKLPDNVGNAKGGGCGDGREKSQRGPGLRQQMEKDHRERRREGETTNRPEDRAGPGDEGEACSEYYGKDRNRCGEKRLHDRSLVPQICAPCKPVGTN